MTDRGKHNRADYCGLKAGGGGGGVHVGRPLGEDKQAAAAAKVKKTVTVITTHTHRACKRPLRTAGRRRRACDNGGRGLTRPPPLITRACVGHGRRKKGIATVISD